MKDLYVVLNKCSNKDFDKRIASRKIFQIKHTQDEKKIQELKFELFKASSKLLIKAINNFFKLTESYPREKVLHNHSDIALECWIIFERCVQNIRIKDHKSYSFFLNTALNRGIYRVFERNYKKHYDIITNADASEVAIMTTKTHRNDFDFTELDLGLNFSDIEIKIINFKVSGEKMNVFLKEEKLSNNQFNIYLEGIKEKLIEMYKTEKPEEDDYI